MYFVSQILYRTETPNTCRFWHVELKFFFYMFVYMYATLKTHEFYFSILSWDPLDVYILNVLFTLICDLELFTHLEHLSYVYIYICM